MACICKCGRIKECGEIECVLCECDKDNNGTEAQYKSPDPVPSN
jgi:hypothetical protein